MWAQAHIAVLPSRREGPPEKPARSGRLAGAPLSRLMCPDAAKSHVLGVNALLVPADNASALADAIGTLALSNPQIRQSFAQAGRHLVENEFSDAQIGRQIVAVYDHLMESRPRKVA